MSRIVADGAEIKELNDANELAEWRRISADLDRALQRLLELSGDRVDMDFVRLQHRVATLRRLRSEPHFEGLPPLNPNESHTYFLNKS